MSDSIDIPLAGELDDVAESLERLSSDAAKQLGDVSAKLDEYSSKGAEVIASVVASARAYGKPAPTAALAVGVLASGLATSPAISTALGLAAVTGPVAPIIAFGAFFLGQIIGAIIALTADKRTPLESFLRHWALTQQGRANWPGTVVSTTGGPSFDAWIAAQAERCRGMTGYAEVANPTFGDFFWLRMLFNTREALEGYAPGKSMLGWKLHGEYVDMQGIPEQMHDVLRRDERTGSTWKQKSATGIRRADPFDVLGCYLVAYDRPTLQRLWDDWVALQLAGIWPEVKKQQKSDPKYLDYWSLFVRAADGRIVNDRWVSGGWRVSGVPVRDYPAWVPLSLEARGNLRSSSAPDLYHPLGQRLAFTSWNDQRATIAELQTLPALDPRTGVTPLSVSFAEMNVVQARAVIAAQVVQAAIASGFTSKGMNPVMAQVANAERALELCHPGRPECERPWLTIRDYESARDRLLTIARGESVEQRLARQRTRSDLGNMASASQSYTSRVARTVAAFAVAVLAAVRLGSGVRR